MAEGLATYKSFRIDDTAEWRLVIYISDIFMSAYLKNIENPLEEVHTLFAESWQYDESQLLSKIEETVFNNPQILDDFATDIIICTDKALWIPSDSYNDDEWLIEKYNLVYDCHESDLMIDEFEDKICAYSLIPGLLSFLRRTLPGARIRCHQSILVDKFIKDANEIPVLYIDVRENKGDYILIDNSQLFLAATHVWHDVLDIGYMSSNIFKIYGYSPKSVQISISGDGSLVQNLVKLLREQFAYVMFVKRPSVVSDKSIPLSVAYSLSRKSQNTDG